MTSLVSALRFVYLLPNVLGYFAVFYFVPATWEAMNGSWLEVFARGYFISLFLLLCFEGVNFTALPRNVKSMAFLIVPGLLLPMFSVLRTPDIGNAIREGVFLYLTPLIVAWTLVTILAAFRQRQWAIFGAFFALIFFVPALSVIALFWQHHFGLYLWWELLVIAMLMIARLISLTRYIGTGVIRPS